MLPKQQLTSFWFQRILGINEHIPAMAKA
jgi:hypothetical protein